MEVENLQTEKSQVVTSNKNFIVEEKKAHQLEVSNLYNELSTLKTEVERREKTYSVDLDTEVRRLKTELEEQKNKNNVSEMDLCYISSF